MAEMYTSYKGLPVANNRIEGLMADFSGLNNLESVVYKALKRLEASDKVQNQVAAVKNRNLSMNEFDGWFAELIRKELGRTLGIVRNQAIKRARTAGGLTNSETATAILPLGDGSCTDHVADHTLTTCLVMHRSRDKSSTDHIAIMKCSPG